MLKGHNNKFIFTFGLGTDKANKCVLVYADSFDESREKMILKYGLKWSMQYVYEDWDNHNFKEEIIDIIK